jgi:hypothetical protein
MITQAEINQKWKEIQAHWDELEEARQPYDWNPFEVWTGWLTAMGMVSSCSFESNWGSNGVDKGLNWLVKMCNREEPVTIFTDPNDDSYLAFKRT